MRKKQIKNRNTYANRGQDLENLLIRTNMQISAKGWGTIEKVNPPVTIFRKERGIIKNGVMKKSTIDFMGHYKGRPVAFDAKETAIKTSFPLKNIEEHQARFLSEWHRTGGAAFLIVEFSSLKRYFYLSYTELAEHLETARKGGRKSIKLEDFKHELRTGRGLIIDYLKPLEEEHK